MSTPERTITNHTTRPGREFITYSDGTSQTRKLSPSTGSPLTPWTPVEPPPADDTTPNSPTRHLSVVAFHQAPNEPKHWSLFSHIPNPTGTGPGQVWQVTGDAELMHYDHSEGEVVDHLAKEDFAWHQVVNGDLSEAQFVRVDEIARAEAPPRAASRKEVREHCQGWTMRVLGKLVGEGIVEEGAVEGLRGGMDPIN
jgi:hypothetical protein